MVALPRPDQVAALQLRGVGAGERDVYRVLYEHRGTWLTMADIRRLSSGRATNEQLDRRKRNLHPHFVIEKKRAGKETLYRLRARKAPAAAIDVRLNERVRAQVLRHGRCAMCGRTPLEDGVKLQVDHKRPQSWGGTDDVENLQPLCVECNRGKKDLFAALQAASPAIRRASDRHSVHQRIGDALAAAAPGAMPANLLELIASPPWDHQDDWQRRMRELRLIGWEYSVERRRESGRVQTYYRLTRKAPWPRGSIRSAVARAERRRRAAH
jgi:5-methylcytosine-specific restriction endonuclease McrA